jgi:uncharacterized protein YajQ (UPF0234 family)
MPSFDVVSEVDKHELTNAIDQANREIGTRFDFKGSDAKIEHTSGTITLAGSTEFQLRQIQDILHTKLGKRGIDISILKKGALEESATRAKRVLDIQEGIDKEIAKKITKLVKESKLKVQAAIQGEQVRITGKKRDDLQQTMSFLKETDLGIPLQFNNFRD